MPGMTNQVPPASLQGLMSGASTVQKPPVQAQSQGPTADVDPNNPDYEGPEDGPFRCDNCTFYGDPNQCSQPIVVKTQGGVVDPAGCCKFFSSMASATSQPAQQVDQNSNMHQYGK